MILLITTSPYTLTTTAISTALSAASGLTGGKILSGNDSCLSRLTSVGTVTFSGANALAGKGPRMAGCCFTSSIGRRGVVSVMMTLRGRSGRPLTSTVLEGFRRGGGLAVSMRGRVNGKLAKSCGKEGCHVKGPASFSSISSRCDHLGGR